uniref:Nesprin-1 n=1 Tax=Phallusia mammillata TaxID=59560 RepID=A0A6F9DV54_9ASCI|nr:nesprin-1 [Phallusia mammillata]
MDNLVGLPKAREPTERVWTANKNNLSFPELRGGYKATSEGLLETEAEENGLMTSPRTKILSEVEMLANSVCRMDLQNAYVVALSAEVYGLLSWLTTTTEQLTKVGTSLQHPNHQERLNKVLAKTMVQISRIDFEKRVKFYQHLLKEARHYLDRRNSSSAEQSRSEQRIAECTEGEYETLHHKGVRSGENTSVDVAQNHNPLFGRLDWDGLTGTSCQVSFTSFHLKQIEQLWNLARVQLQILNIQLNGASPRQADVVHVVDIKESANQLPSYSEHLLSKGMSHLGKKADSVADSCDSGFDRGIGSSLYDGSSMSTKDDGYFSKSMGSEMTYVNDDDNASAEVESLLQGLNFKNKNLDLPGGSVADVQIEKAGNGFPSKEPAEKHWEKIYERVERFSQNTLSLLSWAEEIKDIREAESSGEETYFYESAIERLHQATSHSRRLYAAVKADAEELAGILPSEKQTVLSVVERLELECSGLEIFDHEVYKKKSKPTVSKPTSKASIATYQPSFSQKLYPLTSTPKPSIRSVVQPSVMSSGLSSVSRRVWYDFIDEYNNALGWICQMERYTDVGDNGEFTDLELELWYKGHLKEIRENLSKRERVKAKADYLCKLYPEFRHDAQIRSSEIQLLWERLETNIQMKLIDDPYAKTFRQIEPFEDDVSLVTSASYTLHPNDSLAPRTANLNRTPVPLGDHSFYQIRDKLGFGSRMPDFNAERRHEKAKLTNQPTIPKSWRDAELSSRWAASVTTGSDMESCTDIDGKPQRPGNFVKDSFAPLSNRGKDAMTEATNNGNPPQGNNPQTPDEIDEKLLAEIANTDWDLELSDVDLESHATDVQGDVADQTTLNRFLKEPALLSNQITRFSAWLKDEERVAFVVTKDHGLGWCPRQLKEAFVSNQEQQIRLSNGQGDLNEIVAAAKHIVGAESDIEVDERIDTLALQYSCVMLQQRFLILVLYCADIDCVVDRRIDIVSKNCRTEHVIAHPLDGVWSDRGEPEAIALETNEADYNILHDFA